MNPKYLYTLLNQSDDYTNAKILSCPWHQWDWYEFCGCCLLIEDGLWLSKYFLWSADTVILLFQI